MNTKRFSISKIQLKKNYGTEIWNDSRFKEVQCGTMKKSW